MTLDHPYNSQPAFQLQWEERLLFTFLWKIFTLNKTFESRKAEKEKTWLIFHSLSIVVCQEKEKEKEKKLRDKQLPTNIYPLAEKIRSGQRV